VIHLCAACGGPRPEHQWLCTDKHPDHPGCQEKLTERLAGMPALWAELETTLIRQDVIGGDGGRKSSESAMVFKSTAEEARQLIQDTVTAWVVSFSRTVAVAAPEGAATHIVVAARWLHAHLPLIVKSEDSVALADEVEHAVSFAHKAIDRPAVMLGLGQCGTEGCTRFMYVAPEGRGDTQFECRCGAVHNLPERLKDLASKAEEHLVSRKDALAWVLMLLGKRIPQSTFLTWSSRGKITPQGWTAAGELAYRFGDVRDQALVWVTKGKAAA
jgi:hypothetical protein